jgi:hypothetical protein
LSKDSQAAFRTVFSHSLWSNSGAKCFANAGPGQVFGQKVFQVRIRPEIAGVFQSNGSSNPTSSEESDGMKTLFGCSFLSCRATDVQYDILSGFLYFPRSPFREPTLALICALFTSRLTSAIAFQLSQRRVRTEPQRSDFVACLSGGPLSLRTFGLSDLPSHMGQ